MVGAVALALASPEVRLSWTHSVERVEWQEEWRIGADALTLRTARVRGSGAGMEPGEGARLVDGWWEWAPGLAVPELALAASGATVGGWTLCADGACRTLGAEPGGPVVLRPCDGDLGAWRAQKDSNPRPAD